MGWEYGEGHMIQSKPYPLLNMVEAWTCMAANRTGSLVFTEDVTADRSSGMDSKVNGARLSVQIQSNAAKLIGWHGTIQLDNDPKHIE